VHVLNAAEEAVEGSGEDDDGNVGAAAAKKRGDFGAELAGAEMIVEDGDVDVVEMLDGLIDGGGGNTLVSVLAEDGGAEVEIAGFVIEQENAHGLWVRVGHEMEAVGDALGRLNHGLTSL
jgi:hypothetical protein